MLGDLDVRIPINEGLVRYDGTTHLASFQCLGPFSSSSPSLVPALFSSVLFQPSLSLITETIVAIFVVELVVAEGNISYLVRTKDKKTHLSPKQHLLSFGPSLAIHCPRFQLSRLCLTFAIPNGHLSSLWQVWY